MARLFATVSGFSIGLTSVLFLYAFTIGAHPCGCAAVTCIFSTVPKIEADSSSSNPLHIALSIAPLPTGTTR